MYVESGILVAENYSEYPEAVERTLEDPRVVLLHAPNMVDEASQQQLNDLEKIMKPSDKSAIRATARAILQLAVPTLPDVNQVILDWKNRQPRFRRYPQVYGPCFDLINHRGIKPHLDEVYLHGYKGPLTLSVGTGGEAIFSGDRPGIDLLNSLGYTSQVKQNKLGNIANALQAACHSSFDLPHKAHQKAGDGIWVPNFPDITIHRVRVLRGDDEKNPKLRSSAILDYVLWRRPGHPFNDVPITPESIEQARREVAEAQAA